MSMGERARTRGGGDGATGTVVRPALRATSSGASCGDCVLSETCWGSEGADYHLVKCLGIVVRYSRRASGNWQPTLLVELLELCEMRGLRTRSIGDGVEATEQNVRAAFVV